MNVIKDVTFEGRILDQIQKMVEYIETQVKEHSYLGETGTFVTEREYPKFVIQEMTVNSVCHRDYSIKGTEIQIKMFDDRLVFETPGRLPGTVRADNIRHTHFSRNPKIAEYLKAYDYVKEFGEGVDRMCRELAALGVQEPKYHLDAFILKTTVYANKLEDMTATTPKNYPEGQEGHNEGHKGHDAGHNEGQEKKTIIIDAIKGLPSISLPILSKQCGLSVKATRILLEKLRKEGIIRRIGPKYGGRWEVVDKGNIK